MLGTKGTCHWCHWGRIMLTLWLRTCHWGRIMLTLLAQDRPHSVLTLARDKRNIRVVAKVTKGSDVRRKGILRRSMSRFRELLLKIYGCAKILGVFLPILAVRRGKCHTNLTFREKYEPFSSHNRKILATTLEKSANRVSLGTGQNGDGPFLS